MGCRFLSCMNKKLFHSSLYNIWARRTLWNRARHGRLMIRDRVLMTNSISAL